MRRLRLVLLIALAVGCVPPAAFSQWQAVILHPDGFYSSEIRAAAGAWHGGLLRTHENTYRPVLWNRSARNYVDLLPGGAVSGVVYGMTEDQQVGEFRWRALEPRAALWFGTAESPVDLTPGGMYPYAIARGIAGAQQVGYAIYSGNWYQHAALWYGSAETFIDLHLPGAIWSEAWSTDGTRQGGRIVRPPGGIHAALWHGSAESFVDMNPPGASESSIHAMAGDVQVGYFSYGGNFRACLWRGTPDSFVDLTPAGATTAVLNGTNGSMHVGIVYYGSWPVPGLWMSDDPESFVNLRPFLPPPYTRGGASTVSVENGYVYVGGGAGGSGAAKAVVWFRRMPGTLPAPRQPSAVTTAGQPDP